MNKNTSRYLGTEVMFDCEEEVMFDCREQTAEEIAEQKMMFAFVG